jgi:hypothetical protein
MIHCQWMFIRARNASDRPAQIRSQEVMDRPLPPAYAGANGFLLYVLAESYPFLSVLGVEGSRQVAYGVQSTLVAFEEHLLGVFTEETAHAAVYGLLFSSSQVRTEDAVNLCNQLAVYVGSIGGDDCLDVLTLAGGQVSTYSQEK